MNYWQAAILAFIEGFTEFLPVSSTGHLVVASTWMGIAEQDFVKSFEVIIQMGAILAVVFLYRQRLKWNLDFYKKIFLAFLPTAVLGFLLKNKVDLWLGSLTLVAWSLILGGVVLIFVHRIFKDSETSGKKINELHWKECLILGLCQSVALIPGVSRSGATIVGGLSLKLSRTEAAEFSFLLAVPTMAAATGYKLIKVIPTLTTESTGVLAFGTLFSFVVAALAIKTFVGFLARYGFQLFGWYRIVAGIFLLWFLSVSGAVS